MLASPHIDGMMFRESVLERLRGEILRCELRPGASFRQHELAERYEVSASPVRDALLRLQEEDLVDVLPRKGWRIRPVSLKGVSDIYEVRQMMERESISLLMSRPTPAALDALDSFRTLSGPETLENWTAYNRAFHIGLAESSGNSKLLQLARGLIDQVERLTYLSVLTSGAGKLNAFVDEHAAIIDAIQSGDRRRALQLSRDHIERSRRRVVAILQESQSVVS